MLTVVTTEEFAAWFGALPDLDAEEVAGGIELVETLGPERAPPRSSSLLLWYQCPSEQTPVDQSYQDELLAFKERADDILKHLASSAMQRRFGEVSAERAALAHRSLMLIAARARRIRNGLGPRSDAASRDLLADYRTALEVLELTEPEPEQPAQTLRELRLPGLRVLYGVDAPNARALLILGERLDRCAYGRSTRRALSVWQQFLECDAERVVAARSGE